MRKHLSFVAVTVLTVIVVSGDRAQASPFALKQDNVIEILKPNKPNETPQLKKQTPTKHKVKSGDSLTKIAKTYNSSVQRLFDKNKNLSSPDVIEVGQIIVVPKPTEKLKKREVAVTPVSIQSGYTSPQNSSGGGKLIAGTIGNVRACEASGANCNCVNEPGVHKGAYGNPEVWPVLFTKARVGATALWTYNHTGVVTGIWSNGDIEVRHQNYGGGQTRFPASAFRGFR